MAKKGKTSFKKDKKEKNTKNYKNNKEEIAAEQHIEFVKRKELNKKLNP